MTQSKFIQEIMVIDPDTNLEVHVSIYKEIQSGGMFGVDSSYIENEDDGEFQLPSIFDNGITILID